MERGILMCVFLAFGFLLVPGVLAEVWIGETESLYNLGDVINVTAGLSSGVETIGFFSAYLVCGLNEIEIHKSIQVVNLDSEKEILIQVALDGSIVGNVSGSCYIRGSYGAGVASSRIFEVINDVNVRFSVEGVSFVPGDVINITGKVVKGNGAFLNGFVEIVFEGVDLINYGAPKLEDLFLEAEDDSGEEDLGEEREPEREVDSDDDGDEEIENEGEESEALKLWKELHPGELPPENAKSHVEDHNESDDSNEGEIEEEEEDDSEDDEENDVTSLEIEEEGSEDDFVLGTVVSDVTEGVFSVPFVVPSDAPPGTYRISARAYDKDRVGKVMNEGVASSTVRIRQVVQVSNIAFNLDSITPGNEFLFTPLLYDQAGNQGEGEMEVIVYKPDKSVFMNKILKASEKYSIFVETNFTPGYWKVETLMGEIKFEKDFFVEEFEKISSVLEGDTLIVKNVGNVLFDKPVEITIGEVSDIKPIRLEVGESRRFKLAAPDGEYKIAVSDGSFSEDLGVNLLTGRAISVDEIGGFLSKNYWMVILLLVIVVFIVVIIIIIRKIRSGGVKIKVPKLVGPKSRFGQTGASPKPLKMGGLVKKGVSAGVASGAVVDGGRKKEVSLISLKIKNLSEIQSVRGGSGGIESPTQVLDSVLLHAKSAGAKIYVDKEYRVIIFSPGNVKTEDNELKAVSIAKEMDDVLKQFNTKSIGKINYGIGVHSGEMAVEERGGKTKFVSLGNTVAIVKRLSENSSLGVLMSDQFHRKTLGKIRVARKGDFWSVIRVSSREQHSDFINNFLKRQKAGK